MPTLPTILRIPMSFERRMERAVERGDVRELYLVVFEYSIDGFDGPGYLGYIFYILYFIQLIQAYFKYIIRGLSIHSRERVRRNLVGRIHVIRKSYYSLLSDYERAFMKKYGVDDEWIRSKILSRSIDTKVDNLYYSSYFKEVRRILDREGRGISIEFKTLYRLYTSLMKTGIEVSLILAWTLYLYTYLFHFLRGNGELDELVDKAVDAGIPSKLVNNLRRMARLYGFSDDWIMKTFKDAVSVFSKKVLVNEDEDKVEVKVSNSWPSTLLIYTFVVMGVKLNAKDVLNAQRPMCRLCRLFWVGIYSVRNKGVKVNSHTYRIRIGLCILKLEEIREADKEAT